MAITKPAEVLMIEPFARISSNPLIDHFTRKMAAAWRKRRESEFGYRGQHRCACGAMSDNKDHWVGDNNLLTNSLCVHYLAFHRDDIPEDELHKITSLPYEEVEPSLEELADPETLLRTKPLNNLRGGLDT